MSREMTVITVAEELYFPIGRDGLLERPILRDKCFKEGGVLLYRAVDEKHVVVMEEVFRIKRIVSVNGITNRITMELECYSG